MATYLFSSAFTDGSIVQPFHCIIGMTDKIIVYTLMSMQCSADFFFLQETSLSLTVPSYAVCIEMQEWGVSLNGRYARPCMSSRFTGEPRIFMVPVPNQLLGSTPTRFAVETLASGSSHWREVEPEPVLWRWKSALCGEGMCLTMWNWKESDAYWVAPRKKSVRCGTLF